MTVVMTVDDCVALAQKIVQHANDLKNARTGAHDAPVNYACIFCNSDEEFDELCTVVKTMGNVVKDTPTGPLFRIVPIATVAGQLQLLKIRKQDPTRTERGDADFTVNDFASFKQRFVSQTGFKLITRPTMEMLELMDSASDIRVYFSNSPLDEQLGITNKNRIV